MRVESDAEPAVPLGYASRADRVPGPFVRWFAAPIGWPFAAAAVAAAALAVYAASDLGGLAALAVAGLAWVAVGGTWAVRGIGYAVVRVRHPDPHRPAARGRWAAVPVLFLATVGVAKAGAVNAVAFRLSRPAMERSARLLLAQPNGPSRRVDVGLYGTSEPIVEPGVVYFPIDGISFLDRNGFAYSPAGPPRDGSGPVRHLAGPWYRWHDDF